jgi:hypothetical protein
MEQKVNIDIKVNAEFDSLYKLGNFLVNLNAICNFATKINENDLSAFKFRGITSRRLTWDSVDTIQLKEYRQGSFIATIAADVISGVILLLLAKYINRDQDTPKFETKVSNQTVINIVNITYRDNVPFDENMAEVFKKLKKQGVIEKEYLVYDKNGKKLLWDNIDRMKGALVDGYW